MKIILNQTTMCLSPRPPIYYLCYAVFTIAITILALWLLDDLPFVLALNVAASACWMLADLWLTSARKMRRGSWYFQVRAEDFWKRYQLPLPTEENAAALYGQFSEMKSDPTINIEDRLMAAIISVSLGDVIKTGQTTAARELLTKHICRN